MEAVRAIHAKRDGKEFDIANVKKGKRRVTALCVAGKVSNHITLKLVSLHDRPRYA